MEVLFFFTINADGDVRPWRMTFDDVIKTFEIER